MTKKPSPLFSLLIVVFLDLLGFGIVIPILASLFLDPASTLFAVDATAEHRTIMLGLLLTSYPLAQFFGAPILGALSDRYGRRPILLVSLLGTCVGFLLFAVGIWKGWLWLLFVSRIQDGFTGGNISTAQSAIADLSKPEEKSRNFGLIGMAFGLGFIVGPFLGGVFSDSSLSPWFSFSTPFLLSAVLAFCNMLLILFFLPETLKKPTSTPLTWQHGFKHLQKSFTMHHMRILFLTVFFLTMGFTFFTQFYQVYLVDRFQFTTSEIGYLFGYTGLWIAFTQGGLNRALSKRFSPMNILRVAAFGLGITFFVLLLPRHVPLLLIVTPFIAIFQGLIGPNLTAVISNTASRESQGEIMGIQQAISSVGQTIPPFVGGFLAAKHVSVPLLCAGVLTLVAWMLILREKKHGIN